MSFRCETCERDFIDERALQGHIVGKIHLKRQAVVDYQTKTLCVAVDYNDNLDALHNFFIKFGNILSFSPSPRSLQIKFEKKESVDFLLSKPFYFNGRKLLMRRPVAYTPEQSKKNTSISGVISPMEFKEALSEDKSFSNQLGDFVSAIKITEHDINTKFDMVKKTLQSVFRASFPRCVTYRFGSTVTGLGFKNCDLDIFLDIGEALFEDYDEAFDPHIWTPSRVFKEAKRLIYRKQMIFSNIVTIPRARTPIIKVQHTASNVSCDISFKNALGVHNSLLIRHYLSLDPRLEPMIMVIKFWGFYAEHTGPNKISNYALVLLVIFYLQQVKVIPTVHKLQSSVEEPLIIEGWQVNFDCRPVEPASQDLDIPHLLHGFFEYYAHFDFTSNIVCPLDGQAYPKSLFDNLQIQNIPESMVRYRDYLMLQKEPVELGVKKIMCIQDPFKLNYNTTIGVQSTKVEEFQQHCALIANVCQTALRNNDHSKLLLNLITCDNEKLIVYIFRIMSGAYLRVGVPKNFDLRMEPDRINYLNDSWFRTATHLIKKFFERVMKCNVEVLLNDREPKQAKIEAGSDINSRNNSKVNLHVTGSQVMWRDRKMNVQDALDPTLSQLDKEALVSDKMIEEQKGKNLLPTTIDFTCLIQKNTSKQLHAMVTIKNKRTDKKIYKELGAYCQNNVHEILGKTMQHMMQFNEETTVVEGETAEETASCVAEGETAEETASCEPSQVETPTTLA